LLWRFQEVICVAINLCSYRAATIKKGVLMDSNIVKNKAENASKWSLITELLSKIVAPLTNMVLARLLAPEAFGYVATITMVTSFAAIFADAGVQSYLIQKNFRSEKEYNQYTTIGFWLNLFISIVLWLLICIFRNNIADAVGSPGLGPGIAISSVAIPLTAFTSIQIGRFKRALDFKSLFYARLVGIIAPIFVTIPLAFILRNYWAMVIGTIFTSASNAVILSIRSDWKPSFWFNFTKMKQMLGFSIWAMSEKLLGWANLNIGIFLVGKFLTAYYLGIFKTSMAIVNQMLAIILNSFSPVLLSSLSRLCDNKNEYESFFYDFEEKISIIVLPIGVGIFVYKELVTHILLGSQWEEAISFVGLWGLLYCIYIVYGMFQMEVFVSQGKPQYSVLAQILMLACLFPTILITVQHGYKALYIGRSLILLAWTLIQMVMIRLTIKLSPWKVINKTYIYLLYSIAMGILGFFLQKVSDNIVWVIITVLICIVFYFSLMLISNRTRSKLIDVLRLFLPSKKGEVDNE